MPPTEINNTPKYCITLWAGIIEQDVRHLNTINSQREEVHKLTCQASFPTHSLHEAGVKLVLGEDVQVEALDAEKHGGLDHGEGLLQPVAAGYHRQVHGRLGPAGDAVSARLRPTPLAHDVPVRRDRKMDGWLLVDLNGSV